MSQAKILLVEDDPSVSQIVSAAIEAEDMRAICCYSAKERDLKLSENSYDLMITDVGLGEDDGLSALCRVKQEFPDMPVIVISAQNTLDTAVRATEADAFEYFPKPFDIDELLSAVKQAVSRANHLKIEDDVNLGDMPMVGRSAAMQDVFRMIAKLLRNDLSVLILGESGTGKELVAEAIHNLGHRKAGPFVAVNMAAIPSELIEAELFGHEKGAFTGAVEARAGKFEQARGGTLFLDEIGDMPMEAQTRLLRALQSGEIVRVGGKATIKLDVRIVAATNKNIEKEVEKGAFREDLYYRINVVPITLPPLRDRADDIDLLAQYFVGMASNEGLPRKQLSEDSLQILRAHSWRGNVRELKNLIYRLAVSAREDVVGKDAIEQLLHVDMDEAYSVSDGGTTGMDGQVGALDGLIKRMIHQQLSDTANEGTIYRYALEQFERPLLIEMLKQAKGNQIKAAQLMGINRNTLRKKLTDYQIDPENWNR